MQVWKDVHAANPNLKLFGPDGVAESPFTSKLSASAREDDLHHGPDARSEALPGLRPEVLQPTTRRSTARIRSRTRSTATRPWQSSLDAIKRAGDKGNDRQAVIDQFFATKDRDSVLGKYSINENGDTTLTDYGAQKVENGKLVFDKVIKAKQG